MIHPHKRVLVHITTAPQSLYNFFCGQIRYMVEQGYEVHGISSPGNLLDQFAAREGAIPHAINMPRAISPLRDLVALWQLCALLIKIKPDVIHAHTPKAGLLGMIASFIVRVPVRIYHVHGLPYLTASGIQKMLLMVTEIVSCKLAQRVLFVSQSVRKVAITDRICSGQKSKILNHGSINGIDAVHHYNPERSEKEKIRSIHNIPLNYLVIGFVGRIVGDKGVVELLLAWESLKKQFDDILLLVVGPIESRDAVPPELIKKLQTDSRIRFVGEVRDTFDYYTAMDILAFPSYREGFSMVTLEASAMSIPIVATKIPGNMDSVVDGKTGTFVSPRNSQELEHALAMYINNGDLRKAHGRNGRERVLELFRPQDIWESLSAEYEEMIKKVRYE